MFDPLEAVLALLDSLVENPLAGIQIRMPDFVGVSRVERPKLSDPAHEGVGLQPRADGRVRCSAWLGDDW